MANTARIWNPGQSPRRLQVSALLRDPVRCALMSGLFRAAVPLATMGVRLRAGHQSTFGVLEAHTLVRYRPGRLDHSLSHHAG
jgi:hypothetical protein